MITKRPHWIKVADWDRLRTMAPDDALAEVERLIAENKAKKAESWREYYQRNREAILVRTRKNARKNRSRIRVTDRQKYARMKEDPELLARYRARHATQGRKSKPRPRTDAMRERDRRKWQRKKTQNLARNDPSALRKLIRPHVPGYLAASAQMDVINSVMVQALERKVPFNDLAAWVKKSVTEYNRQFDHFKNVSIDAPIAGTDGLTRADLLDSETFHF